MDCTVDIHFNWNLWFPFRVISIIHYKLRIYSEKISRGKLTGNCVFYNSTETSHWSYKNKRMRYNKYFCKQPRKLWLWRCSFPCLKLPTCTTMWHVSFSGNIAMQWIYIRYANHETNNILAYELWTPSRLQDSPKSVTIASLVMEQSHERAYTNCTDIIQYCCFRTGETIRLFQCLWNHRCRNRCICITQISYGWFFVRKGKACSYIMGYFVDCHIGGAAWFAYRIPTAIEYYTLLMGWDNICH